MLSPSTIIIQGALHAQLDSAAEEIPIDKNLYDLRTTFPWVFEPNSEPNEILQRMLKADPEFADMFTNNAVEAPPVPGARRILHWETRMVSTCLLLPYMLEQETAAVQLCMRQLTQTAVLSSGT